MARIVLELSNTAGQMRQILHETDLVSLLSASMLHGQAGEGLSVLPFAQARIKRSVGIAMLKDAPVQPLTARLIELLMAQASG